MTQKKKRTHHPEIENIQRKFRRRIFRDIHAGIYLATQVVIWLWWFATAQATGQGFHANFFADRVIVTLGWGILLLTHFWIVALLHKRDEQIAQVKAQLYDIEDDLSAEMLASSRNRLRDSDDVAKMPENWDEDTPLTNHRGKY